MRGKGSRHEGSAPQALSAEPSTDEDKKRLDRHPFSKNNGAVLALGVPPLRRRRPRITSSDPVRKTDFSLCLD
jgi:hypothetical protein